LIVVSGHVGVAVTGKRELATFLHLALIDHAANRLRELRAADAVENDLSHGDLAPNRLAARFEIDCGGEAAALPLLEFGLALTGGLEGEALLRGMIGNGLGRRRRAPCVEGCFQLAHIARARHEERGGETGIN